MEFTFGVISTVTLDHKEGAPESKLMSSQYNLFIDDVENKKAGSDIHIDKSMYLDGEGYPTAAGCQMITEVLVTAISGNIHAAHQQGFKDSAQHFREIIKNLEDQFILNVDIEKSAFGEKKK